MKRRVWRRNRKREGILPAGLWFANFLLLLVIIFLLFSIARGPMDIEEMLADSEVLIEMAAANAVSAFAAGQGIRGEGGIK